MSKPVIAVTLGDPAGIGPEIVVKALADPTVREAARVLIVGDRHVIDEALDFTGVDLTPAAVKEGDDIPDDAGVISLLEMNAVEPGAYRLGEIGAAAGRAAYEYIAKSIELAMAGKVDAVATTPINKESLQAAGVPFIGHTEIFGALTGTKDPLTMFAVRSLRIFFLTRHVSLRQACDLVTKERIIDYVPRISQAMQQLGMPADTTIAVAGLNPHSGENGLFGDEEVREVSPAIEELRKQGYPVVGPIGADSVFHLALMGHYGCVLSLYHDQGHIAAKTLDFERTISVTCGMPILRTSVDHGTALDIAGKNIASPVSMIEAIRLAACYAPYYTERLTDA
jgi:4-hydroxythreonine-4-phosphate dehydrogenase